MIRIREKLKAAVWFLLIVRNGAFAEGSLNCFSGIIVDGKDGYNDKAVPESVECHSEDTCLRVDIDEVIDLNEKKELKNVVALKCIPSCEGGFESATQFDLEANTNSLLVMLTGSTFDNIKGIKPSCCSSENCNSPKPETSSGNKLAASLTLLVVSVASFFN